MKQTENNIMLYFLQKRNYRRSKEKRSKKIAKREAADKFVAELMFSGEIYDQGFYQLILGKKLPLNKRSF